MQSNSHTACACYYLQEVPVLFIDYGNEEHVTDVVMKTKQLLNWFPFQAIPVQLSGIVFNHSYIFFSCCGFTLLHFLHFFTLLCTAGLSAMGNFKTFKDIVTEMALTLLLIPTLYH